MLSRPSKREYFIQMLSLVASRSTCIRRAVGCIITDKEGHILSTGYNGTPKNFDHCVGNPCRGATDSPGDTSHCMAIHAEANALLQCSRLDLAHTMYCSCSPCFQCGKMICNTDIKVVICKEAYSDTSGIDILIEAGISVEIAGVIRG